MLWARPRIRCSMSRDGIYPRVSSLAGRTAGRRRGFSWLIHSASCLTVGVATITAATIAFVPSVEEPAPAAARPQVVHVAAPAITLTAGVQPLAAASVTDILALIVQHYVVPPSAGAPFPTPQFPPVVAPTSIGSSIIWVYNAVEPWARWVADVAAYAVGWIPYVGWLAPQIPIFYNFGERIARSITYNIAVLARRGHQLHPRLDQCRRRHGQRVHPARHRPMELLAVAASAASTDFPGCDSVGDGPS